MVAGRVEDEQDLLAGRQRAQQDRPVGLVAGHLPLRPVQRQQEGLQDLGRRARSAGGAEVRVQHAVGVLRRELAGQLLGQHALADAGHAVDQQDHRAHGRRARVVRVSRLPFPLVHLDQLGQFGGAAAEGAQPLRRRRWWRVGAAAGRGRREGGGLLRGLEEPLDRVAERALDEHDGQRRQHADHRREHPRLHGGRVGAGERAEEAGQAGQPGGDADAVAPQPPAQAPVAPPGCHVVAWLCHRFTPCVAAPRS